VASVNVIVGVPQASVAVGEAKLGVAGHSIVEGPGMVPKTGAVLSSTVITCVAVAVLPQASLAVNVLVTVDSLAQAPGVVASVNVIVGVPQASVAVGEAKLGVAGHSIVEGPGMVPKTGAVLSSIVITCVAVAVLPQASLAVNVLVTVDSLAQAPGGVASVNVIGGVPQASVAVGEANEGTAGHSIVEGPGMVPKTGAVLSSTVITCVAVAVLPQASLAVNVLVTVDSLAQAPGVVASVNVIVGVPQASVAVGEANEGTAGHSIVEGPGMVPKTGAVLSSTVITCVAVAVLPQASLAVNVLVTVDSLAQAPGVVASVNVIVGVPQASVAVGEANEGTAGHSIVEGPGMVPKTGAVLSSIVITCVAVAVLPQASLAVNVLVTVDSLAQAPGTVASVNVIVGVPQASVAVGEANEGTAGHSIVEGPGMVPKTGAVLSSIVITCVAVAVLPQASLAVNVLVTVDSLAQAPGVVASVNVIVGVPQASVAVGEANEGTAGHSIVEGPGMVPKTGAVLSSTVITCVAVAVLPQASLAVNVLVTVDSLAQAPGVVASVNVIVGVPQASVAVGEAKLGVAGHSIVEGPGMVPKTGAVLSSIVITCVAVAVLPQASLAVNVLVTVDSLAQAPGTVASVNVIVGVPQASVAVGEANEGTAGHSIVEGPGMVPKTGAVLSSTVITCVAVAVLPQASLAVNVLVTVDSLAQA